MPIVLVDMYLSLWFLAGNAIGDVCETDYDGDGVIDDDDVCPKSNRYHTPTFDPYTSVNLESASDQPVWYITDTVRRILDISSTFYFSFQKNNFARFPIFLAIISVMNR